MKGLSRRSALRTFAVSASAMLLPELSLTGSGGAGVIRPGMKLRGRELAGAELDRAVREVARHEAGAPVRDHLSREGFSATIAQTIGVSIEASDGTKVGRTVVTTLHDRASRRSARLVYQGAGDRMNVALAVWADERPDELAIFGVRDRDLRMLGTVTFGADEIIVDDIETGRKVLPRRIDRRNAAHAKGTGLAALVSPTTQTMEVVCQDICSLVTFTVCGLTCEYAFFVVCTVVLALTGLPGLACFLISFGVCTTTCYLAQEWVCSSICA